jgi:hypothetical protein
MEPGTVRQVPFTPRIPGQRTGAWAQRSATAQGLLEVAVRPTADQSTPDEPMAVLVAGCHDSGKREVIRALLREGNVVDVPPDSYLVMRYDLPADPVAHVPGCRQPRPYRPGDPGTGDAALARPPRRVELSLPDPLLRHFALVDSPCARRLGVAGGLVLGEAAERGGAVVFVAAAGQALTPSELALLGELASRDVTVFFAVVPAGAAAAVDRGAVDGAPVDGAAADGAPVDGAPADGAAADGAAADVVAADVVAADVLAPVVVVGDAADAVEVALEAHRAVVAERVPGLAEAPWFAVDPVAGDTAYLRRALVEWAGDEGLRRASDNPPVLPVVGSVAVGPQAAESGWSEALNWWLRSCTRQLRQRLAIEVADIHLRCVRDLVFGTGCAGLPSSLDHELHALSQKATAESDTAVASIVHDVLRRVLGGEPTEDVRRRVVAAVRQGLAEDTGADLNRVLLVTSTGGVATISGRDALVALPGYAAETVPSILPPIGMAVSGGCYVLLRGSAGSTGADVANARSWLQRVTRAVDLELRREVGRRLEAVHRSLGALVGETVEHGKLLA